ncbi:MAG: tetratricopeptide repeat protein [Chloroflexota bacterium]
MPDQSRSGPEPSHNLPARLTSFVGRERDVAVVGGLVRAHRLVTLAGAPGVGKTRLALQVARSRIGEHPDGVWLVELASLADPGLVPQAIADMLGVREHARRAYTDTLMEALRDRALLLLLDNCEHLIEAVATLADTLLPACPGLTILATSREPLAIDGEVTYRVPSLTVPESELLRAGPVDPSDLVEQSEALRLFVDRAQIADPSFLLTTRNCAAAARVCARLDGIPLAVELAAAQVRALSAEEIAAHLDDRFRLLTGGSRTALPRQRTLAGAVGWSYDLLTEPERALLRRLSVFAGGAHLEAIEAVGGAGCWELGVEDTSDGMSSPNVQNPTANTLDVLTSLIDKSLVVARQGVDHPTRYGLLEMVRQFGRERLEEAGEGVRARQLHRDCYRTLAERAHYELWRPDAVRWLDRLEREHDNLRAALTLCAEEATAEPAGSGPSRLLALAGALWRFWFLRGHWDEGYHWVHRAIAIPPTNLSTASLRDRAIALFGAAELTRPLGDLPGAVALKAESLALWRDLEDEEGVAMALGRLAHFHTFLGQYDEAEALCTDGLRIARRVGSHRALNSVLMPTGDLAFCRGDYAGALVAFQENLKANRAHVDPNAAGSMLQYAGIAARELGRLDEAEAWMTESVDIFSSLARNHGLAVAIRDLGLVHLYQGEMQRAAARLGESLRLSAQLGARWNLYECLYELANVAVTGDQPETAARLHGAAEELRASLGTSLRVGQRERYDRYVEIVRDHLGDVAFDRSLADGRAMPLASAVELGLAVAEQPGPAPAPPVSTVPQQGPLSRRELQIATLVARGLTNRQIAAQLDLSQRPVDAHVRNALGKLDLSSRAQLAAWTVGQGFASIR